MAPSSNLRLSAMSWPLPKPKVEEDGDLTGAASVLERYLLANPKAVMARAEYTVLLCRLDDLAAGGAV
jgi:hypothetical protein